MSAADEQLETLVPFSGVLARAAIAVVDSLDLPAVATLGVTVLEPSDDPRVRALALAADATGGRWDSFDFEPGEAARLLDPETDPEGAVRWRRYADEALGLWRLDLETPDGAVDELMTLHTTFCESAVEASARLAAHARRRWGADLAIAFYADDLEVSLEEANERANDGELPDAARAYWREADESRGD